MDAKLKGHGADAREQGPSTDPARLDHSPMLKPETVEAMQAALDDDTVKVRPGARSLLASLDAED